MKKLISVVLIAMMMVLAAGCDSGTGGGTAQSVPETTEEVQAEETSEEASAEAEETAEADPSVDVDLTALNSTMVYAQVYDMLSKPDDFKGQTVKMSGPFAVYTDESSGKNYFACVIQDATACCAQGLEFELKGKHDYPGDYPEQGEEITVVGTFDTYEEGGSTYCTLRNAKML